MSEQIKIGDRRIFRSASAREIEIIEQLAEDPFAGEFRYRYTDTLGGTGILPAENLEMSTRPAPGDPPADAPQDHGPLAAVLSDRTLAKVLSRPAHVPPIVLLDMREAADALANAADAMVKAEADAQRLHNRAPARVALDRLRMATEGYRAAVQS